VFTTIAIEGPAVDRDPLGAEGAEGGATETAAAGVTLVGFDRGPLEPMELKGVAGSVQVLRIRRPRANPTTR